MPMISLTTTLLLGRELATPLAKMDGRPVSQLSLPLPLFYDDTDLSGVQT